MIVPSGWLVAVPWPGVLVAVIESASPSTSVSFATTLIATGVSSGVVAESLTATGGSLTAAIVIVTVATFESSAPSFAL